MSWPDENPGYSQAEVIPAVSSYYEFLDSIRGTITMAAADEDDEVCIMINASNLE
jgi:hypothetical protein